MIERIRKANKKDVLIILECFKRCTYNLLLQGIDQWDYSYPSLEQIRLDVERNQCYIIKQVDGIATITINSQQDAQYKNINWKFRQKPVYVIHRLAVDPVLEGNGYAKLMVRYVEDQVRKLKGQVIRLDTYSKNVVSNTLYQKMGYQLAEGNCYFHGNKYPFFCYEKLLYEESNED